jgi:hypothetical protein
MIQRATPHQALHNPSAIKDRFAYPAHSKQCNCRLSCNLNHRDIIKSIFNLYSADIRKMAQTSLKMAKAFIQFPFVFSKLSLLVKVALRPRPVEVSLTD